VVWHGGTDLSPSKYHYPMLDEVVVRSIG